MIKLILQLIAIRGVLCAPGIPFTAYGGQGEFNLAEKSLPFSKPQQPKFQAADVNSGYFPGTRNLGEKSIPDRVTLNKLPDTSRHTELPWQPYNGGFIIRGGYQPATEGHIGNEQPKYQTGLYADYQPPIYPNPTPNDKFGSEIKETGISPSANIPSISFGQFNNVNDVPSTSEAKNPINIPPASSIKLQDIHNQYSHGFSNPDGTQVQESGHLISTDDGWEYVIAKVGSYRYVSPEGIPISVRYIADENGFRILDQDIGNRYARSVSP